MLEVYPIGKARFPAALDDTVVKESIDAIARLPGELREAVEGCRDLDHHIREGAWSIRALVHHVADSHMNAYVRTKLALTEDDPTVKPYDEAAWARLPDSGMDVGPSLDLVTALHARWVGLLRSLGPAELERPWLTPAAGARARCRVPVAYAGDGRHHVAPVVQPRPDFGVEEGVHGGDVRVGLSLPAPRLADGRSCRTIVAMPEKVNLKKTLD